MKSTIQTTPTPINHYCSCVGVQEVVNEEGELPAEVKEFLKSAFGLVFVVEFGDRDGKWEREKQNLKKFLKVLDPELKEKEKKSNDNGSNNNNNNYRKPLLVLVLVKEDKVKNVNESQLVPDYIADKMQLESFGRNWAICLVDYDSLLGLRVAFRWLIDGGGGERN